MTDTLATLLAFEEIKRLKARYFRTLDEKRWDDFAACFTEDLVADFRDAPGTLSEGREVFVSSLKTILEGAPTVHHGHTPELTLVDEQHATGVWAMDDIVELPDLSLRGWGHYHEEYRSEGGEWKIARTRLSRLRLLVNGEAQAL